ncbi:hypothetical protein BV22DRAFT_1028418 [Leucogyrophana mollusca]|uniref:Uncharacterized protein n=1 Tax=Leucogyrophana mollusca TaxID=85980 RepID=A0ACB8C141_9AGAM|nr:hypothetical protein BV22DRAFT_1028418 [Leucogyrophana mollusca]
MEVCYPPSSAKSWLPKSSRRSTMKARRAYRHNKRPNRRTTRVVADPTVRVALLNRPTDDSDPKYRRWVYRVQFQQVSKSVGPTIRGFRGLCICPSFLDGAPEYLPSDLAVTRSVGQKMISPCSCEPDVPGDCARSDGCGGLKHFASKLILSPL